MTSGDTEETLKCKTQQLSADRLQLNREVDFRLCQLSGARKWVLAAKSLAYLQQTCFPWSTFCKCNCLKIHLIGWRPDLSVTYLNLNLKKKANNLKNSHNIGTMKTESTQRNNYQIGRLLWPVPLTRVRLWHLCSNHRTASLQLGWPEWSTGRLLTAHRGLLQAQELGHKAHL